MLSLRTCVERGSGTKWTPKIVLRDVDPQQALGKQRMHLLGEIVFVAANASGAVPSGWNIKDWDEPG